MEPYPPKWLVTDYNPEKESFSGWRKCFAFERESILIERRNRHGFTFNEQKF